MGKKIGNRWNPIIRNILFLFHATLPSNGNKLEKKRICFLLLRIFLEFKLGYSPKSPPSKLKLVKHIVMMILPSFLKPNSSCSSFWLTNENDIRVVIVLSRAKLTWSYSGAAVAMTCRGSGLKTDIACISNLKQSYHVSW